MFKRLWNNFQDSWIEQTVKNKEQKIMLESYWISLE